MADLIAVGKVVSVNYPRRELRVAPFTERPEQFTELDEVRLVLRDGAEVSLDVESSRAAGKNVCLKVGEEPRLDKIDGLKGAKVVVAPRERVELPAGEYYEDELVGLNVRDGQGIEVGRITAVYPMDSHHDVYEVTADDGGEYLVAAVESAVLDVDVDAGFMTVESAALVRQGGHAR